MKAKPRGARRRAGRRTELCPVSKQAARRAAKHALQRIRLEEEDTASREGVALLAGQLALFAFTCAAAFSLGVMLVVASWADVRSARKSLTLKGGEKG
jgi:histidine ammonia-lyase